MRRSTTRVVAYLRVSTQEQAEKGLSLAAQRAKVTAYAALHDLELVAVVVDAGVSAKTLDRPGLTRALAMLGTTVDALLVVKLDRLTRSVRDLGALVEDHFAEGSAALLSVGEHIDTRSAAGRLVLNVLASVSQWEREAIGERTSAVMRHKASQGEHTGGAPPYGWTVATDGVRLAIHAQEQATTARARALRKQGLSLRAIAAKLAAEGRLSRTGTPFVACAISNMLTSSRPLTTAA